jgi:hypothetical protein
VTPSRRTDLLIWYPQRRAIGYVRRRSRSVGAKSALGQAAKPIKPYVDDDLPA